MPAMNMLFRVIYHAHANGTHHKLALDALRHLQSEHAAAWRAVFLNHAELYLLGSKAPDKEFKDFKNHVLHVRDNYWGGAPEKVESWYRRLVKELQQGNWEQAVWCAGVLSHYYVDPIHPFHTAQCEAENNIHRAVEWSIARSYGDLRQLGLRYRLPVIHVGTGDTWLKDMVIAGAERANYDYETLIAGYNFEMGVVDPPAGLDPVARDAVGRLLVYASCSFAHILDRAFEEAGVVAPDVNLTMQTLLRETLKIPLKWLAGKKENAREVRQLKQMYDEYRKTGRVEATLSEDERIVRDLHSAEVVAPLIAEREAQRGNRLAHSPIPYDSSFALNAMPSASLGGKTEVPVGMCGEVDSKGGQVSAVEVAVSHDVRSSHVRQFLDAGELELPAQAGHTYLKLTDNVEAAPSIGPKTAERMATIGIETVQDFLAADPEELAQQLAVYYIRAQNIVDWQDQSRLMLYVAGLRVTQAQLCVGAGYRTPEAIAAADATQVSAAILRFVTTHEGRRILGNGRLPNLNAIKAWIDATGKAIAA